MSDPMFLAVLAVSSALVLTKLLDVVSTLWCISAPDVETNPLAGRLMVAIGVRPTVWMVFVVACAVVGVSAWLALRGPQVFAWAFCVLGIAVSVVQACVARANFRGRHDAVTRGVLRWHGRIGMLVARLRN